MSTEAITLFVVPALGLALLLIAVGLFGDREEREDAASTEAERAARERRRRVARLDADRVEAQRQAIVAGRDPRGLGDGLGTPATGRFSRPGPVSDPAPSPAPLQPAGRPART